MSSSAHISTSIAMGRQSALGGEFLIFLDPAHNEIFIVEMNSLRADPADRDSVNREISSKKQSLKSLNSNLQIANLTTTFATAGNENIFAIAWAEHPQPTTFHVTLVAIRRQNEGFNLEICPNGTHDVSANEIKELEIILVNNEPKVVDIYRQGGNFVLEAYGH